MLLCYDAIFIVSTKTYRRQQGTDRTQSDRFLVGFEKIEVPKTVRERKINDSRN